MAGSAVVAIARIADQIAQNLLGKVNIFPYFHYRALYEVRESRL